MINSKNHNPDILSCLANLSNDEVFTPPDVANRILDLFPKEFWSNPKISFLDPFSKSGVFLREIAKRLIAGLEKEFPNLDERINQVPTFIKNESLQDELYTGLNNNEPGFNQDNASYKSTISYANHVARMYGKL